MPNKANIAVNIKNLSKIYTNKQTGEQTTALKNIDLEIYKGDIFGIIGMSGAGKSTLVRTMNFLEAPTSGTVELGGEDLAKLGQVALRKKRQNIGMVFQQFNLCMQVSVLENVCLPLKIAGVPKEEARKKAKEMLELVGILDKATAYPSQLSGGQKQRVGIARALVTDPEVLLCDEATSALDPQTTDSILNLLEDINHKKGITIVIITHEMDVVQAICNRVAIIDSAQIAECGKVEDIFSRPKSEAAKKFFYKESGKLGIQVDGGPKYRLVFDKASYTQPIIANLILDLKIPVSILYADIRDIDSEYYGQTVLQMPADPELTQKAVDYLLAKNLQVEEVKDDAIY